MVHWRKEVQLQADSLRLYTWCCRCVEADKAEISFMTTFPHRLGEAYGTYALTAHGWGWSTFPSQCRDQRCCYKVVKRMMWPLLRSNRGQEQHNQCIQHSSRSSAASDVVVTKQGLKWSCWAAGLCLNNSFFWDLFFHFDLWWKLHVKSSDPWSAPHDTGSMCSAVTADLSPSSG